MSVMSETTTMGPLSHTECKQVVDDILDSVRNPQAEGYNPALAVQLQLWNELKNRAEGDPTANAIVDLVKAGQHPLLRLFPGKVQNFISKVSSLHQSGGGGDQGFSGGGYGQGFSGTGGGGGSRYR